MLITSALPGFRELRAALIPGYLYLSLLWIWFGQGVGDLTSAGGVSQDLHEIGDAIGAAGLLAAASVAAYLLGSFINQALASATRSLRARALLSDASRTQLNGLTRRVANEARRQLREARVNDDDPMIAAWPASLDVANALDGVREQLIGDQSEFLAEADRHHAEAEFRAALILPVTLVAITVATAWLPALAIGAAVVAALTIQAIDREQQHNLVLAVALSQGRATSGPVLEFQATVADCIVWWKVRRKLREEVEDDPDQADPAGWVNLILHHCARQTVIREQDPNADPSMRTTIAALRRAIQYRGNAIASELSRDGARRLADSGALDIAFDDLVTREPSEAAIYASIYLRAGSLVQSAVLSARAATPAARKGMSVNTLATRLRRLNRNELEIVTGELRTRGFDEEANLVSDLIKTEGESD
jgi:hypothetical protein